MLYFSKLRILSVTIFSLLFILIASSNLFKVDDSFFDKKINLGLDLQGGSYLLLEINFKKYYYLPRSHAAIAARFIISETFEPVGII